MYRIYRNLHSSTWTVQHKVRGKGWRKLAAHESIVAERAAFTYSEAGRARAQREGTKNVHAYAIVDEYMPLRTAQCVARGGHEITYTPFDMLGFRCESAGSLTTARGCTFMPNGTILATTVGSAH